MTNQIHPIVQPTVLSPKMGADEGEDGFIKVDGRNAKRFKISNNESVNKIPSSNRYTPLQTNSGPPAPLQNNSRSLAMDTSE